MDNSVECGSSAFVTPDRPTWDLYAKCIHCGLCLNQCPTYRVLGLEADSPRGRIYQVLQADAGRLSVADSFMLHMDRCLGCRACETACPSGVKYGRILERTRAEIERKRVRGWLTRQINEFFYARVLRSTPVLTRCAKLLKVYQRSGLQWLARHSGLLHLLGLAQMEALAPRIDDRFYTSELGRTYPALGQPRGSVAFMSGCIANLAFSDLNRKTVRVFNQNGIDVLVPENQCCCGALHAHAGRIEQARELARANIDALRELNVDAIISNAAGCGAMMKGYGELLEHDPIYAASATQFAAKVRDVNEYLTEIGLRPARRFYEGRKITYQDSCHLAHGQGIRSAPRELIKATGAALVEMPHADQCCGSAGTYNIIQNEIAMKLLDAKMDEIEGAGVDIIATANVGCILQLRAGVVRRKLNIQVKHVIELLDDCYPD